MKAESSVMRQQTSLIHAAAAVLLCALVAACNGGRSSGGGTNPPPPPPAQTVARVIVTPSSILLQPGSTAQLTAHAIDASGASVTGAVITWTASGNAVRVGSDGNVMAGNSVDSAVVTASVGSISSAPVTALVVSLNPGAQIIADSQVVVDPALVDHTQVPGPGSQLKVTLSGTAPAVGSIIVGSGDKPISGMVTSTATNGANTDVVFQVLALADVFSELKLNQTYTKDQLTQRFEVQPSQTIARTDGAREYEFVLDTPAPPPGAIEPKATSIKVRAKSVRGAGGSPSDLSGSVSWKAGPFKCSAKSDLSGSIGFSGITPHVIDNLGPVTASITVSATGVNLNLSTKGSIKLTVDGKYGITGKLSDSAKCDARLFDYLVPVPPAVALIFIPVVPVVGLRASISGTLDGDVHINLKSTIEQPMTVGMTLASDGTFTNTGSLDGDATTDFGWTLGTANPGDVVTFSGDAKAGLYAQAGFTNAVLLLYADFKSDFDPIESIIDAFGGFHATLGISSVNNQLQNPTLPAGYVLTALAEIQAGDDLADFVKWLSKTLHVGPIVLPDLKFEPTLFSHPTGNARASLRRFAAGDTEKFQVVLDPTTVDPMILGNPIIPYNVKQVEIWRKTPGGQSEMVGMDVGEAGTSGAPGKNTFTILWKADAPGTTTDSNSGTAPGNFYAVVVPNFGEDFGFRVGPALGWLGVHQFGGPNDNEGRMAAVDRDGNLIIASISGDPLAAENRSSVGGSDEIQLFKLDPYGQLIWARNIDGPGDENVIGMVLDAQGNIFISGRAIDSPLTPANIGASGFSGWAASYSTNGTQLWLNQWQDAYYSSGDYIALGPNREVYVLGAYSQSTTEVGGTAFATLCNEGESGAGNLGDCGDLNLRRLDPNTGALQWATTDARAGWQLPRGLTVDAAGYIYTSAQTSVDTETENVGDSTQDGFDDFENGYREPIANNNWTEHVGVAFAKWDSSGEVQWRKTLKYLRRDMGGGDYQYSDELSGGIVAGSSGLWAAIRTTGAFPGNEAKTALDFDSALFSVDSSSGEATLTKVYATTGDDELFIYGPTPNGGLLMTGFTNGALYGPNAGGYDAVAISLNADGSERWGETIGGPGNDLGIGAAASPDGSIYITGFTDGLMPASLSGFPVGTPLNLAAGGKDLFIAKMGPATGTIQAIQPTPPAHQALLHANF
jgi:hypothetical protein